MIKFLLLTLWLTLTSCLSFASISANLDRSTITFGETFTLTIDVTNSNSNPDIDNLRNNFDVLDSGSSSSTTIIDGQMSSQKTFTISLYPKNIGSQKIPAIKVGNDYTSELQINVLPASTINQNAQLFVTTSISNKTTYLGVPLVYDIKFYYSVPLSNLSLANIEVNDVNVQSLGKDVRYTTSIKGRTYQVIEQKFQLTPTKPGIFTIPPAKVSGRFVENDRDNFFSFSRLGRPFIVSARPLQASVKGIPNGISLADWFPAQEVTLNESWSLASSDLKIGQPLTRTITITATGITHTSIPELKIPNPSGINAYADRTTHSESITKNSLLASKTFKIAYIPTQAGKIEFPEFNLKWWNISSNSLKTIYIPAKTYNIVNNESNEVINNSNTASNSTIMHHDIKSLESSKNNLWRYISLALTIIWILTIAILWYLFKQKKTHKPKSENRHKKIVLTPPKKINLVYNACTTNDLKALNQALIQWAAEHWQKKIYTVSDIKHLVQSAKLKELLEKLELALYCNQDFNEFEALRHEIADTVNSHQQATSKTKLKQLYPN